jgi:hypothetical protein
MKIGATSAPLTVPLGTALGGYVDRIGGATGTRDELQIWCVRLGEFTLVVADAVCVHGDLAAAVSTALGGPVWTLATHTHWVARSARGSTRSPGSTTAITETCGTTSSAG